MAKPSFSTVIASAALAAIVSASTVWGMAKFGVMQPVTEPVSPASVKQALMQDPEMLNDVISALQAKRQYDANEAAKSAVKDNLKAIYEDTRDPYIGPKDAPFTLVEFFDYNCPYCKEGAKWVEQAMADHPGKIRVIYKDFPVLEGRAEGSLAASIAAQAVWAQGPELYRKFHFAMMQAKGGFDQQRIDDIAKEAGVDLDKMHAAIKTNQSKYLDHFQTTFQLAGDLNIEGTPGYVVNGEVVHGANTEYLEHLLDQQLSQK